MSLLQGTMPPVLVLVEHGEQQEESCSRERNRRTSIQLCDEQPHADEMEPFRNDNKAMITLRNELMMMHTKQMQQINEMLTNSYSFFFLSLV